MLLVVDMVFKQKGVYSLCYIWDNEKKMVEQLAKLGAKWSKNWIIWKPKISLL